MEGLKIVLLYILVIVICGAPVLIAIHRNETGKLSDKGFKIFKIIYLTFPLFACIVTWLITGEILFILVSSCLYVGAAILYFLIRLFF